MYTYITNVLMLIIIISCFFNLLNKSIIVDAITTTPPPNFIIIFIDDTGYGDYSFNNNNVSDSPNLQKYSKDGMIFSDFHAAASVCTPSRAALLTGRLGVRTGVKGNFGPFSKYGLPLNETTIAEIFSKNGYATCMTGKWQ